MMFLNKQSKIYSIFLIMFHKTGKNRVQTTIHRTVLLEINKKNVDIRHLSRLMTKPTKWHVRPVKTQIRLWSEALGPKILETEYLPLWL